jgi:YVTN family beta-propeller protein
MKRVTIFFTILAFAAITFSSCVKDDKNQPKPYESGVFVVCQGKFTDGTGTVSFYDRSTRTSEDDIFGSANSFPLGNVAQSMEIYNGKAYIVVNNSGKVEVADAETFKSTGVITGLTSPRYFIGISATKGYISDWSNNVAVVDLTSNTITKTIPVNQSGPEKMLKKDNKVFVINGGGWGIDSTVTVIDVATDAVIKTIVVGKRPTGIQADGNKVWVMCSGKGFNGFPGTDDTEGHLIGINPATLVVEMDLPFPNTTEHPENLLINNSKTKMYYLYRSGIYQFDLNQTSLSSQALIQLNKYFPGMGLDPATGYIYAADPVDYVQNGWVFRYNPNTAAVVDSFKVGIIPTEFYFK